MNGNEDICMCACAETGSDDRAERLHVKRVLLQRPTDRSEESDGSLDYSESPSEMRTSLSSYKQRAGSSSLASLPVSLWPCQQQQKYVDVNMHFVFLCEMSQTLESFTFASRLQTA